MSTVWDQQLYDTLYSTYGYNRAWADKGEFKEWLDQANFISQRIGINNSTTALFVGCGLGFLLEVSIDLAPGGWDDAWGTDTSSYIQSLKLTDARADIRDKILNINILDVDAQQQLKAANVSNTGKVQWIITDLISGFEDVELSSLFTACDNLIQGNGGVAHIIYPTIPDVIISNDTGDYIQTTNQSVANQYLNMKTADQWVATNPSHWWIDVCGWARNSEGKRILVWNPDQGAWT